MSLKATPTADMAIAYVSLVVPDAPEFRNLAVHSVGVSYMQSVLSDLKSDAGAEVESFSAEPIPSFPQGRRLLVRARTLRLEKGLSTRTVTFVNFTPLKQLHIGLSMLWRLIGWGLRSRSKHYRVVFSFNISVPPLAFTLAAAILTRSKLLAFISDLNVPGETVPYTFLGWLDAWCGRKLLRYLAGAVVVSDAIARDYLQGRSCIRVDGGVTRQMIEKTGRLLETRQRPQGRFTIVTTGALSGFNGISEILAAFAHLEGPGYRLIVAGRGPLGVEVEEAVRRDPRIEFPGYLAHRDVLALHSKADVLLSVRITGKLNTSYAFPSKTFEYLLSGVPVITTATGHMKTEYGPYCFVLEEQSPLALAALVRRIEGLTPAERSRIGLAARQFIIDNKAWDVQCGRIAEFVRSTATGKQTGDLPILSSDPGVGRTETNLAKIPSPPIPRRERLNS